MAQQRNVGAEPRAIGWCGEGAAEKHDFSRDAFFQQFVRPPRPQTPNFSMRQYYEGGPVGIQRNGGYVVEAIASTYMCPVWTEQEPFRSDGLAVCSRRIANHNLCNS